MLSIKLNNKRYKAVTYQLAVSISLFILLIEGVLLVVSYNGKKNELHKLNVTLSKSVMERYGVDIPDVIEEVYIDSMLDSYTKNIVGLNLRIAASVLLVCFWGFYQFAGKHLFELISFNKSFDSSNPQIFPEDKIPDNDIGELIYFHNEVINSLSYNLNKLQVSEKNLKEMSTFSLHNPDPVLRVTGDGVIIVANPSALRHFDGHDLMGAKLSEIFPGVSFEDIRHLIVKSKVAQREVSYGERRYLFKITGVANLEMLNIYSMDITEQTKLQKQVFLSSKLASIGELAAGVGHEINNPLAISVGNIALLKKELSKENSTNTLINNKIKQIEDGHQRIKNITDGLRTYARSDNDQTKIFPFRLAVDQTLNLIQEVYQKDGINIKIDLPDTKVLISGHVGKLQQIIMNLVSNAKDATKGKEERQISFKLFLSGTDKFTFSVTDNGTGIPQHIKDKIFEPFFTTKKIGEGTGMGLGIVNEMVRSMDGTLNVKSEENKGSTFSIIFPKATEKEKEKEQKRLSGHALVVDDEEDIREILKNILEGFGLTVDTADDGITGLEKVKVTSYDYICTDMKMPYMCGDEFIMKAIKILNRDSKFFVVTGGVSGNRWEEIEGIIHGKINKPFDEYSILDVLTRKKKIYN
jgi:signal transduction histidine kinase/CheY-like chemotaxis protein